MSSISDVQLSL